MAKAIHVAYAWREVVPLRGAAQLDAQRTGEIVARLTSDDKPTELWKQARQPRHYLHRCYQWNVQRAAEAHWRDTSLKIIRCLYVIDDEYETPVPAFTSLRDHGRRDFYQPKDIVGNPFLELSLMRQALSDLQQFRRRYGRFAGICQIVSLAERELCEALKGAPDGRPRDGRPKPDGRPKEAA